MNHRQQRNREEYPKHTSTQWTAHHQNSRHTPCPSTSPQWLAQPPTTSSPRSSPHASYVYSLPDNTDETLETHKLEQNSNENGYCTPTSLWSSPHSPTSSIDHSKAEDSHDDAHSPTSGSEESSKLQKGRRGNRYKNCSESVLSVSCSPRLPSLQFPPRVRGMSPVFWRASAPRSSSPASRIRKNANKAKETDHVFFPYRSAAPRTAPTSAPTESARSPVSRSSRPRSRT